MLLNKINFREPFSLVMYSLVKAVGGQVSIVSSLRQGTVVKVGLPVARNGIKINRHLRKR